MLTEPPRPRSDVHHGKLCWVTRWYGEHDLALGRRPQYTQRWYDVDEKQALKLYSAWLARWREDITIQDPRRANRQLNVAELCERYLRYAEQTYRKNNRITSHVYKVRTALQLLTDQFGDMHASALDMATLARWRDSLAREGVRTRHYINAMLHVVQAMYRWGAEVGLLPSEAYQAVKDVSRLRKGRTNAAEHSRVEPVAWPTVEQTLPHLSDVVAAMVKLLWYTGMRPDEVCAMRAGDLQQGADVWIYRPGTHKTDYLEGRAGEAKMIPIGPEAQKVITPYLRPDLAAYLFQPSEGARREYDGDGERYTSSSLRRAVHRGCDAAWPPPEQLRRQKVEAKGRKRWKLESERRWRERLGEERWAELLVWWHAHRWSPNQLRHSRATEIRRRYGLEPARTVLGHTSMNTTEIYAEKDLELAKKIARETG